MAGHQRTDRCTSLLWFANGSTAMDSSRFGSGPVVRSMGQHDEKLATRALRARRAASISSRSAAFPLTRPAGKPAFCELGLAIGLAAVERLEGGAAAGGRR